MKDIRNAFSECPSNPFLSYVDLMMHKPGFQFFTPAVIVGKMPTTNISVKEKLQSAFAQMPKSKRSFLDSLELVTNFVFYNYIENDAKPGYIPKDCDSIALLLEHGLLGGECGDMANYEVMIIHRYLPHWGEAIVLSSSQDSIGQANHSSGPCHVSHVYAGLADKLGRINVVFDPNNNGVWCDSISGKPLSLDSIKAFLMNGKRAYRVVKRSSTFFGKYNSKYFGSSNPCIPSILLLEDNSEKPVAYSIEGNSEGLIIRAPFKKFDYRDPEWGDPQHDWLWEKMGIPKSGWGTQDMMLLHMTASVGDPDIIQKCAERYGFDRN